MSTQSDVADLLLGVQSVNTKEQKVFDGQAFPLILIPTDAFKNKEAHFWNAWVKKNLNIIENLLLKYGAILFRGFPFDTPKDFDEFAKAYGYDPFPDIAGIGVRSNIVGNVYTAAEAAPESLIPFHHEMAHVPNNPHILFFYCDVPAKEGGNTPLALSNVIYRKMLERDPDFVNRLEKEGVRYCRVAPNGNDASTGYGRSWQSTFFTSEKEEAEKNAKASGYDFEWLEDGSMKITTEVLRAIRVDKRTGKKMWFNSVFTYLMILSHTSSASNRIIVIFPNGEPVSAETLDTMKQVMDEVRVSFKWLHKDVALIDNRIVQHSRDDFVPPRRIFTSQFRDHEGPTFI